MAKKTKGTKKAAAKRELIDIGSHKRFGRRGAKGQFKELDDAGKSVSQDRRKKAKTKAKWGDDFEGVWPHGSVNTGTGENAWPDHL